MIVVPASRERRTVFRVYPDALRAGKVWIWHRLAALDVVRSHVARDRRLNAGTRERLWGVYVRGYFFFLGGEGGVKVSIYIWKRRATCRRSQSSTLVRMASYPPRSVRAALSHREGRSARLR